ncbi:DUF4197 domain-containing protein [Erythrobacteraceae bacterium CFH 75059]|uniref:DUF4197 domain-containing protein n=1 Tax=Qipengyuania thermophila TaxID=2509361 RepID=UPI00101FECE1|nr:DUF4197 domain-containing protein [Qipengyuania thermophila]TCD04867.1 DUF4197 domain-containing protein [Erythrobacteraceae bacterium CFH 75059]
MTMQEPLGRRTFFMAVLGAGAALTLPGCQTARPLSLEEAVRRLLFFASDNAFARMTRPGGFWDQQVAAIGLGNLFGLRGDAMARVLTSPLFRDRMQAAFSDWAIDATARAAPVVTDAVRTIGFRNAYDLVHGDPRGATAYLRAALAGRLIEVMVPGLANAMAVASDPLMAELLNAATGVNVAAVARSAADRIDDVIWRVIAEEEALIRADPRITRDPVLMGVFGPAARR